VVVEILVLRLFFPARKAGDEPRRVVTIQQRLWIGDAMERELIIYDNCSTVDDGA
jgi:hypothetical protein